jgi:hypothetical protein
MKRKIEQITNKTKDVTTLKKRRSVNEVLMMYAKNPSLLSLHSWFNIYTWGLPKKNGSYSRKLGKKVITISKDKDGYWRYIYNKYHSTAYTSIDGVIQASYSSLKKEIHQYIPT